MTDLLFFAFGGQNARDHPPLAVRSRVRYSGLADSRMLDSACPPTSRSAWSVLDREVLRAATSLRARASMGVARTSTRSEKDTTQKSRRDPCGDRGVGPRPNRHGEPRPRAAS
jgi:hypothetical protein